MRSTYTRLIKTAQNFAIDDSTTSTTNLSDSKTFLANETNNTVTDLFQKLRNYKTQPTPRTFSTVADQIYYHNPPGLLSIESVTISVGDENYPLKPIHSQATWNVYTTGNNWGTAGAANTSTDREAADIGSVSNPANPTLNTGVNISLTASKIQEMINGGVFTNNGFVLQCDTEASDGLEYHSTEASTESYRPKLVIDYTPPKTGNPIFFNLGGAVG
jgi:hypothetical protein